MSPLRVSAEEDEDNTDVYVTVYQVMREAPVDVTVRNFSEVFT